MKDIYGDFDSLKKIEREDVDFHIEVSDKGSKYAIIAIHGGNIEPTTTEIARAISADDLSFYSFIGKKTEKESWNLHITSSHFDEPRCCDLVQKSHKLISIHGKAEKDEFIMIGGLDNDLIQKIRTALTKISFNILDALETVNGNLPENICNKCLSGKGVQLEISRGTRDRLANDTKELSKFSGCLRSVII